jgi:YD repeat-containing protein
VGGSARDQRSILTNFAYDGMGRVLTSTDANGTRTTVYDDANSNITVTAASGLTETRSYDSRGRLVSVRQTGDGTTRETRYVHNNADQIELLRRWGPVPMAAPWTAFPALTAQKAIRLIRLSF